MNIFCFGNPYIKEDNLALKVCKKLDLKFKQIKDTFQLIDEDIDNSILIDVVQGLDKVQLINTQDLKQSSISTLHDFDLGFFLKLMNKKVRIIGIPQEYNLYKALEETKIIANQLSKNESNMRNTDHMP